MCLRHPEPTVKSGSLNLVRSPRALYMYNTLVHYFRSFKQNSTLPDLVFLYMYHPPVHVYQFSKLFASIPAKLHRAESRTLNDMDDCTSNNIRTIVQYLFLPLLFRHIDMEITTS